MLDSASLGGADHKTPLAKIAAVSRPRGDDAAGLATWQDAAGTRWIAAVVCTAPSQADTKFADDQRRRSRTARSSRSRSSIRTARRRCSRSGSSRDLASPVTAAVVNGVVFALASGESRHGDARAAGEARRRRCCTRSTRRPARSCGRAAPRSRRSCGASGRRPVTARSMW